MIYKEMLDWIDDIPADINMLGADKYKINITGINEACYFNYILRYNRNYVFHTFPKYQINKHGCSTFETT